MSKWDTEKRQAYARQYYAEHREECKEKARLYRQRPEVQEKTKEYKGRAEVKERTKRLIAERRSSDPFYKAKERRYDAKRLRGRREAIQKIQLHYECRNPACPWVGEYLSCMLDFHHFDPFQKDGQVSLMVTRRLSVIVAEINKCVVLCRNCHALHHKGLVPLDESMLCKVDSDLKIIEAS